MNILAALEAEHSKAQTNKIVAYIGNDNTRFEVLMAIFLNEKNTRTVQRAAWPLSCIGEKMPILVLPYTEILFNLLDKNVHDGVKRNILRTYRNIPIPEDLQGLVLDKCFNLIMIPNYPSAQKAFALDILSKICKNIPELASELCLIIKEQWENEKPGFKSIGGKILKKLDK